MFKFFKSSAPKVLPRAQAADPTSYRILEKPLEFVPVKVDPNLPTTTDMAEKKHSTNPARSGKRPELLPFSIDLLAKLESHLKIPYLCSNFPWVVNRLTAAWENPAEFNRVLNSLLVDERGGRQGFPFEALKELSDVGEYYENFVRVRTKGSPKKALETLNRY